MGTTEVEHEAPAGARATSTASPLPSRSGGADQPTIDWSGRGLSGSDDEHDDPPTDVSGAGGPRRLAVVCGLVGLAYIAWIVVDLVVLSTDGVAYTTMHEALDSLPPRIVLALAWLALLYHGLDGLRVVASDFAPSMRSRQRVARGIVGFVLFAVWIPTALVLVWPAIRGWFAA